MEYLTEFLASVSIIKGYKCIFYKAPATPAAAVTILVDLVQISH